MEISAAAMVPILSLFRLFNDSSACASATVFKGEIESKCSACGRMKSGFVYSGPRMEVRGEKWSDVLAGTDLVVSERMLEELLSEGVTGFIPHPIRISSIESDDLFAEDPPHYYLMEIVGRFEIDRLLFDEFEGSLCDECHTWTPLRGGRYSFGDKIMLPILPTWDGSDLAQLKNINQNTRFCSARFVKVFGAKYRDVFGFKALLPSLFFDPGSA